MARNKAHNGKKAATAAKKGTVTCKQCTPYCRVPAKEFAAHMKQHASNARTTGSESKFGR